MIVYNHNNYCKWILSFEFNTKDELLDISEKGLGIYHNILMNNRFFPEEKQKEKAKNELKRIQKKYPYGHCDCCGKPL